MYIWTIYQDKNKWPLYIGGNCREATISEGSTELRNVTCQIVLLVCVFQAMEQNSGTATFLKGNKRPQNKRHV